MVAPERGTLAAESLSPAVLDVLEQDHEALGRRRHRDRVRDVDALAGPRELAVGSTDDVDAERLVLADHVRDDDLAMAGLGLSERLPENI